MSQASMKKTQIELFQHHMKGTEIHWNDHCLIIQIPNITRVKWKNYSFFSLIIALMTLPIALWFLYQPLSVLIPVILILVTLLAISSALIFFLYYFGTKPVKLDLNKNIISKGQRVWSTSEITKMIVRRNTHNERFRTGVVSNLSDEDLLNVSVNVRFSFHGYVNIGVFSSTKVALEYCQWIASWVQFRDDIDIDGAQNES